MAKLFFTLYLLLGALPAHSFDLPDDATEAGKMLYLQRDRLDNGFGDHSVKAQMILVNKGGQKSERKFSMEVLEGQGDGDKSLIIFTRPRDIRGTSLLSYEHMAKSDDQWLYLPSLKRVKRISSANKSGSFVGSEFSYEDIANNLIEKYTYSYKGTALLGGRKCWKVERYPQDSSTGYSKQVTWLDQTNFQVVKVDYFDRKGAALKTAYFNDYRLYGETIWRVHEISMDNHQTGKKTVLTFADYSIGQGLTENNFSKRSLQNRRR